MRLVSLERRTVRSRRVAVSAGLVLATALVGFSPVGPSAARADDGGSTTRVIVQFGGAPAINAVPAGAEVDASGRKRVADARAAVRSAQDTFVTRAKQAGVRVGDERHLTTLVDAVAMTVPAEDVARLRALPGVTRVSPDVAMKASTDASVPLIGAPQVWKRTGADGRPARGSGVTVAVVDTGVDYTHPDLGGGFGKGHRVVAGYDFVNDDPDPMDDNAHGTHVAGIIAGHGDVTGVAPDAQITAYKVLDDFGVGYTSDIIAGMEAAGDPANPYRADVVNLSLGGPGDGTDPLGQAATALVRSGIVVIAAAGNEGPGASTVGTPASAEGVIAVGASTSGLRWPTATVVEPVQEPLQAFREEYSGNPPTEPVTADVVDAGACTTEDYDRVGDVTGRIVICQGVSVYEPHPWDVELAREAERRGALAVLLWVRFGGDSGPQLAGTGAGTEQHTAQVRPHGLDSGDDMRMDRIVVFGMESTQYDALVGDLGRVRIRIDSADQTDQIASFSSRGPTQRYGLKPDLVAPGVEIRSTVPTAMLPNGDWRMSGTSMASPHVAGAAALLRQLHPEWTAQRLGDALVGTAKGLRDVGPTTQGAGRLDVVAAADSTVTAAPSTLSMGLADLSGTRIGGSATTLLSNDSSEPVTVSLGVSAAPGSPGTATVSPQQATIPAGGSVEVTVQVDAARPGVDTDVAGWLTAQVAGSGPDIRVPYLLAARPLLVRASPDLSDGTSTVFVYSPVVLDAPPVVTVTPPKGSKATQVTATLDHGTWYRADVRGDNTGTYRLDVRGSAPGGLHLVGTGTFEVVPPEHRGNGSRWKPIGPNSTSGNLVTTPNAPRNGAMTTYLKAGVWTTDDRGATWKQHSQLPVAGGTGTLVADPRDRRRMWYAINGNVGKVVLDPAYAGRMLRTVDGGLTWTTLNFPNVRIEQFTADSAAAVLVAVTADATVVSRDGGQTWTSYPGGWEGTVVGAALSGQDLYVATFSGVWKIRGVAGGGEPSSPERLTDDNVQSVAGLTADDEMVVVTSYDNTAFASRDGGATWSELYAADGFGVMRYPRIVDGDIYLSGYHEVFVGRDHGASWRTIQNPDNATLTTDVDRWPGDNRLLLSQEGSGLYSTSDSGEDARRIGVQGTTVYDLAVASDPQGGSALMASTDFDVYRTAPPTGKVDGGTAEWGPSGSEAHFGTTVGQIEVAPSDKAVVWKIRTDAVGRFWIYRSADGGRTWENRGTDFESPNGLAVDPKEPDHVTIAFTSRIGNGLLVTRDGGTTWRKYFHPTVFTSVTADPSTPDRLWLGSSAGLYRSDDGGSTVTRVLDGTVSAVTAEHGRVVAGGDAIRVSTDGGKTFTTADSGGLSMRVSALVTSPRDPKVLYAGTTSYARNGLPQGGRGVLRSTDGGRTWVNISAGLQNPAVTSLAVSPDGRWLYAGTVEGGVHRLKV